MQKSLKIYKSILSPLTLDNIDTVLSFIAYQATDAASEQYELKATEDDYEIVKEAFLKTHELSKERKIGINPYKTAFNIANRYFERLEV